MELIFIPLSIALLLPSRIAPHLFSDLKVIQPPAVPLFSMSNVLSLFAPPDFPMSLYKPSLTITVSPATTIFAAPCIVVYTVEVPVPQDLVAGS